MPDNMIPVFTYEDGELIVQSRFGEMRLRWLPEPRAVERGHAGKTWKPFWPEFRVVRDEGRPEVGDRKTEVGGQGADGADASVGKMIHREGAKDAKEEVGSVQGEGGERAAAFQALRDQIPDDVAACGALFASHQWPVMLMVHNQPLAKDLVLSNPVLAYALANNNTLRSTRVEPAAIQAAAYSPRKQRDIAKWLGFPDSNACVKLFGKIPVEEVSPDMLRLLRGLLQADPEVMDILGHLKRVNQPVLELIANGRVRELVKPALLHEVAAGGYEWDGPSPADTILECLIQQEEIRRAITIRPMGTLKQVRKLRARWDRELAAYWREQEELERRRQEELARRRARQRAIEDENIRIARRPFPPPPLPGTEHIVPISQTKDLIEEGRTQSNCVGSYVSRVKAGKYYVYQVLRPQRATLAIVQSADSNWRIEELKIWGNSEASKETLRSVNAWLAQYRISI